jgi:hypothetical protein
MALDVVADGGLVVFDGEQEVGAVFEDQGASGVGLGVEGVEADEAAVQVQAGEELAGDGDFVGLLVHKRAAQEVLAGDGDGGKDAGAAAVLGLLAVEHDEFVGGRGAADLALEGQGGLLDVVRADLGKQAPESGLAGGGVMVVGLTAHAQGLALFLAEAAGEGGEVFGTAGHGAEMGAGGQGQE